MRNTILLILAATACVQAAYIQDTRPLELVSWNLESSGHDIHPGERQSVDIAYVTERIKNEFTSVDLYGFCEVDPSWEQTLHGAVESASARHFKVLLSQAGGYDRLALAYNSDRFFPMAQAEVKSLEGPWYSRGELRSFRPALVVRLLDRFTNQELLFMVNHLARSNREDGPLIRKNQARVLRSWLIGQRAPVIAVGDYNLDYHFQRGVPADSAFNVLTEDDMFRWVKPAKLVPTEGECRNGRPHSRYGSILDFVFAGNAAKQWHGRCEIVTRKDDFCPEERAPDHRPLRAHFEVPRE